MIFKMGKILVLTGLISFFIVSCTKNHSSTDSLMLTGVSLSKGSEMVTIKLDSGTVNSVPVDCYYAGSTVLNPITGEYGYTNCDNVFVLVDPVTGRTVKQIQLPGSLSQTEIDKSDGTLVGILSIGGAVYIARIDLDSDSIKSEKPAEAAGGYFLCSYYYNQAERSYVFELADSTLLSVDAATGSVNKSIPLGILLFNIVYVSDNNTIIGRTYSSATNSNYLHIFNASTGTLLSKKLIDPGDDYYNVCMASYDTQTKCYIVVNDKYVIRFIDIETGKVKKSYTLDNPLSDIKFWRK
jgi:hypothetical protein